jgi:hypothetical protein
MLDYSCHAGITMLEITLLEITATDVRANDKHRGLN